MKKLRIARLQLRSGKVIETAVNKFCKRLHHELKNRLNLCEARDVHYLQTYLKEMLVLLGLFWLLRLRFSVHIKKGIKK